eukprot:PhM_4_TR760/c0_g1_i1/m.39614
MRFLHRCPRPRAFVVGTASSGSCCYCVPPQQQQMTFNPTQFPTFLRSDVDLHAQIMSEACAKHPMNPTNVPKQRPGEDHAPIPCPSGEVLPDDIARKHAQTRAQQAAKQVKESGGTPAEVAAAAAGTPPAPQRPTPPAPAAKPAAKPATTPAGRQQQMQSMANSAADDKKFVCSVCNKGFRLAMALEHHMVTKHGGAAAAVPATPAAPATPAPPKPQAKAPAKPVESVSAPAAPAAEPATPAASESGDNVAAAMAASSKFGIGVATPGANKAKVEAFMEELMTQWDDVAQQRIPGFKPFRAVTADEVMKHATALKAQVVLEKEEERRQAATASAPTAGVTANYVPPNLSTNVTESAATFNPFEALSSVGTVGGTPRPDETFNPFASLVGNAASSGPADAAPAGLFDSTFDANPAAPADAGGAVGAADSLMSEIMPTEEKKFHCNICGKAFKTQTGLQGHYEAKHPGQQLGSATASVGEKHVIGVNLENIPAYVPTPVDLSKIPGQGTSEADTRAVMAAEDIRNNIPSLDQDIVVHARTFTNITLSGRVVDVAAGFVGSQPVTQFGIVVDGEEGPETVTVRTVGAGVNQRVRAVAVEGSQVLVVGLLKLNPVADTTSAGRYYNNPYVCVTEIAGTVTALA